MAAGLPVVANPVGVQKQMIRHGETGFLVETAEEWAQAIQWLGASARCVAASDGLQAGRRLVVKRNTSMLPTERCGWQRCSTRSCARCHVPQAASDQW